jgi:uncharacterized repeat protein (TIGR03803 family)
MKQSKLRKLRYIICLMFVVFYPNCRSRRLLRERSSALVFFFIVCICSVSAYAQTEVVLHSFDVQDGSNPLSNLIYDPATQAFYGTTSRGGATEDGLVFALKQNKLGQWMEETVYTFQGVSQGDCTQPDYGLTAAYSNGVLSALYGTCYWGGTNNDGAVFALTPRPSGGWNESIVYSFYQHPGDAAAPEGGVVIDQQGNLYGVTQGGGALNGGTVYELTPNGSNWTETILYNFEVGAYPQASLVFDAHGALYGTTTSDGPSFSGTAFQLLPPTSQGQSWTYNLLHNFTGNNGTGDGAYPVGGLLVDSAGVLYGTTHSGGDAGLGTVFALLPPNQYRITWEEKPIYLFTLADGAGPEAGLIFGGDALYGTTSSGGTFDGGTAFRLQLQSGNWVETILWSFGGSGDGSAPWAQLMFQGGFLYSTTQDGGAFNWGAVYRIMP